MQEIRIRIIPQDEQRYPTVGDYFVDSDGVQQVRVSSMGDWRYEFLVTIHELVELAYCRHSGISEQEITRFDLEYEKARPEGDVSEPGDSPLAPYHKQHKFATFIERAMAFVLDVDWVKYSQYVEEM